MTVGPTNDAPVASTKQQALAQEQRHLDAIHTRVEHLRSQARQRLDAVAAGRLGSTFQAQFERDVVAHHHANRASRFTFGDVEALMFGRLDLADEETLHIGKVSVIGEHGDALLVDWRAPAAAAFYQATAARPQGVARRRTLVTRGRDVRDLDDEILDVDAADRLGLDAATGQGALLAALERRRDGTMHEIVATIQSDQDAIIRAPAVGTLVVAGGPGTGKTVVALHRVASLLYRDRERFSVRGVLVVGPSEAFTDYTSKVLPALGEDRVVQRPLSSLCAVAVSGQRWDDPEIAAVKGSLTMADVCRRLLITSLPALHTDTRFSVEGVSATVPARRLEQVRSKLLATLDGQRSGRTYEALTSRAKAAFTQELWRIWIRQRRQLPTTPPEHPDDIDFAAALDSAPAVTMLSRSWWPTMDPIEVFNSLASGQVDLADLAEGSLTDEEIAQLRSDWRDHSERSVGDIALIDELAALIGSPTSEAAGAVEDRQGWSMATTGGQEVRLPDLHRADYRDFAHVVVDEAQDLTPMQWRALARRGEYASWTVVGDLAQRSRSGPPETWEEVGAAIGRRQVTIHTLDVNYRTPAEIVAVAGHVLRRAGGGDMPRAVRATGVHPQLVLASDVTAATRALIDGRADAEDGSVAVLTTVAQQAALRQALVAAPSGRALAESLRVLDVRTAKGLEFDHVIVVDPDAIVAESSAGWQHLYIAVTRATRQLTVVAREPTTMPAVDLMAVTRWEES